MDPLKPGDRVAVYGVDQHGIVWDGIKAVVTAAPEGGTKVQIKRLDGRSAEAHPKQLRRLVLKERRRVWMNYYVDESVACAHNSKAEADAKCMPDRIECVEFIEVRKKRGSE